MSDNYDEKYTRPDLRRKLKAEIKQSDKGGEPGQWSARKSQLLVQRYEQQGGGYKKDQKDEAARSLEEWTEQNWQTLEGDNARQDKVTKRYLPEEVWERLSESEQKEARATKKEGSKAGEQYVEWTPAIKRAMREAGYLDSDVDTGGEGLNELTKDELYEQAKKHDISGRSKMDKGELVEALQQDATDAISESDSTNASSNGNDESLESCTKAELYEKAQALDISGRSKMNKGELIEHIDDVNP